ncbi:6205_t:CDS:2, partial [Dentiscutata erythropus]
MSCSSEDGQKRRKSTGRRVSFATTASVREYYKEDAANGLPASSNANNANNNVPPQIEYCKEDSPNNGDDDNIEMEIDMDIVQPEYEESEEMSIVSPDKLTERDSLNENFNVRFMKEAIEEQDMDMSLIVTENFNERFMKEAIEEQSAEDMSLIMSENENLNVRFMKEAIEEQSAQIQIFETERDDLLKELQNLQNQHTKLQNEKIELNKGIAEAKRLIHENKCFTEEDRIRYRDQYENLIVTNLWRPVTLSDEFVHMIYDNILQVKVNLKAISCEGESITSIIDVSFIIHDKMTTKDKQYYQIMLCGMREYIMKNVNLPIQMAGISKILKDFVSYWQKIRKLYREIFILRFSFPIEFITSNDDNTKLCLRVLFFHYEAKSNFFVNIIFRPKDVFSYPLFENIEWTLERAYGNINEQAIFDTIKTQFSKGGIGCLKATCTE